MPWERRSARSRPTATAQLVTQARREEWEGSPPTAKLARGPADRCRQCSREGGSRGRKLSRRGRGGCAEAGAGPARRKRRPKPRSPSGCPPRAVTQAGRVQHTRSWRRGDVRCQRSEVASPGSTGMKRPPAQFVLLPGPPFKVGVVNCRVPRRAWAGRTAWGCVPGAACGEHTGPAGQTTRRKHGNFSG